MPTFVKTVGPRDATMFFVGEAPGEQEDRSGTPFKGYAGRTLDTLLASAQIDRNRIKITNVAREKPPGNNIGYYFEDKKCKIPKPILLRWIELLKEEIEEHKPNIVVALGNTALWALTGSRGIATYRGTIGTCSLVPGQKMIATYHPQKVNYEWQLSFTTVLDLQKAQKHSKFPEVPEDPRVFITNPTKDQWIEYCNQLYSENIPFAVDIEATRGTSYITRLGFSHSKEFAMSLHLLGGSEHLPMLPERDEIEVWEAAGRVLEKVPTIYHNASYDISVIWLRQKIKPIVYMDTMIVSRILWPEASKSLAYCTSICLDLPEWKTLSSTDQGTYNCYDVANTLALSHKMEELLKARQKIKGNERIIEVYKGDLDVIEPAVFMQLQGIIVNKEKQKILLEENKEKLSKVKEQLDTIAGREINYNSHQQVQQLLYIENKLPVQFQRRKSKEEERKITSDEKALERLKRTTNSPLPSLILEHRKYAKRESSFLDIDTSPEDKVHTSYNITGSKFSRWSSSKSIILPFGPGNLQNIPLETRQFYVPKAGRKLVCFDYVQAEAVVTAYLSLDTVLMKLFQESFGMSPSERKKRHDVHRYTASVMYSIQIDAVTRAQRIIGKKLRHACNYRAGIDVIAHELETSKPEAKLLQTLYMSKNHALSTWHRKVEEGLRQNKTIVNCLGRPHRFLGNWSANLVNSAISYNPQSTIGDLMNRAIKNIYDNVGDEYNLWLQLHDGIYLEVEKEKVDKCIEEVRSLMLIPFQVGMEEVTIDVDMSVGDSWGELKEIDIDWR